MSTANVTTELDAVNTLLSTVGEAPVNSLQGVLPADVAVARNVLAEVSREIQLEGWHFNTERDFRFLPDPDGFIAVPPHVFRISLDESAPEDVVQRGSRLYDRANHTYRFSAAVAANVAVMLPFDALPEAFRWYATVRAARKFQDRTVGSPELHAFTETDEMQARVLAQREDMELARPGMAKGEAASFLAGWTVSQTLRR